MVDARSRRSVAAVLVAVELSILFGPPPLRIPAGLILGLILPGVVLAPLLSWPRLEGVERLLLVPGMSVVIAIIAGLVMSAARVRLTIDAWALALGLVTVAGLALAVLRDRHTDVGVEPRPTWRRARSRGASAEHGRVPIVAFLGMLFIATVAVTGAFVISAVGEHYRGPGFTELWALPGRSSVSGVRLGVVSHELHAASYRLLVSIDGRQVRSARLILRPGQGWQSTQPVTKPGAKVDVWLEKWPSDAIYRHVDIG
jgi:uncharacterized membrane protein